MSEENAWPSPLVSTLIQELSASKKTKFDGGSTNMSRAGPEVDPEQVLSSVLEMLPVDESVAFDEQFVKDNLDAILIAMLAMRSGTHGKALIGDLSRSFDTELSSGTVYPRLYELRDDEVLAMHELVQTKEYSVTAEEVASRRIEREMYHHLTLGLFLSSALNEP